MLIGHIGLWVRDLEAMKTFYCRYFEAITNEGYYNRTRGFRSYFLSFESGAKLELMSLESMLETALETTFETNGMQRYGLAHLAFEVPTKSHVEALTSRLIADGYRCTSMPRMTGDGYYESVVVDPEGNAVELVAQSPED
ncbi:MAG: lactoylglutathione lyase [Clostridiales bacterium]|jgi:lactoylglutathione lyase|nr:lactoylglutathione lyase [Clostridiales bacterium]MDN5297682.1 lactoylglutathione lyase [Clostridiales bacterium]